MTEGVMGVAEPVNWEVGMEGNQVEATVRATILANPITARNQSLEKRVLERIVGRPTHVEVLAYLM